MKTKCLLSVSILIGAVFCCLNVCGAAQETIRITCWDGYADATIVKEFKDLDPREKTGSKTSRHLMPE